MCMVNISMEDGKVLCMIKLILNFTSTVCLKSTKNTLPWVKLWSPPFILLLHEAVEYMSLLKLHSDAPVI